MVKDKDKPTTSGLSSRKRLTPQNKGVAKSPASKRRIKIEAALARAAKLENPKEASVKTARKNPDSGNKENKNPSNDNPEPVLPFDLDDYQETVKSKIAQNQSNISTSHANENGDPSTSVLSKIYD